MTKPKQRGNLSSWKYVNILLCQHLNSPQKITNMADQRPSVSLKIHQLNMSYYFPNNFEILAFIVQFHQYDGGELPIFILEFNVLLSDTNEVDSFQFLVYELGGLLELVGIGAVGELE